MSVSRQASPWDETDLDMFRIISEISPNATPCDLAELCLKPCYEVMLSIRGLYNIEMKLGVLLREAAVL
jgi:hypothetical protein